MIEKNLIQGSKEWHEYRASGVGASEIASIVGIQGAFKTRSEVLMEKLGQGKEPTEYQKKLFSEGHEWEAVVRESLNADEYDFQPLVVESAQSPRLFASLDGLDRQKRMILEVKSVSTESRFNEYAKTPPAHYLAQVQFQLYCSGMDSALLAFVFAGDMVAHVISPDPRAQAELVGHAVDFLADLDHVRLNGVPAPVQSVESPEIETLIQLKQAHAEASKKLDELDSEIKALAERILSTHGATQIENDRVNIQWIEREGSVDYKKIPELQGLDLSPYRKKGSKFIQVRVKL
jgi:putative phage-type endonuclease